MRRMLRKVKQVLKKAVSLRVKKMHVKVSSATKSLRRSKPKSVLSQRKITVKKQMIEAAVGESKFYIPPKVEEKKTVYPMPAQVSSGYGQDRIVLQVRDPWWIHVYWEITDSTWMRLSNEFPIVSAGGFKRVLRLYDVSQIVFTGNNAHRFFDIEVIPQATNWYIDTHSPGRSWCVDFGLLFDDGRFMTVVRSNIVSTPFDGPSSLTDEEWMIPEDMFTRLYGMGVGIGIGSSPLKLRRLWQERLKREFSSGALFSVSSPVKKEKSKDFWLEVNTELIVYGQTEPDAKLTVQGRPVGLRPDGSFSLRFFLPNGKQIIPVIATSSDGDQVRSITPIVVKETK